MPSSPVDLVIGNVDGCETTIRDAVTINPGPLALSIDPPVIYDGFDNTLKVYVANFPAGGPVTRVELVPPAPDGNLLLCEDGNIDPAVPDCTDIVGGGRSGTFNVNLPAGTLSLLTGPPTEATFNLKIDTTASCDALLVDGLRVVSVPEVATMELSPAFGKVGERTALTVTMTAPVGGLFVSTPRVYLTNVTSGGPLASVAFVDAESLTVVVPDTFTLSCGTDCFEDFDLTAVNPTGELFIQSGAFRLSTFPPPRIDNITPGQLPGSAESQVQVTGEFFSNTPSDPTAELVSCRDFGTGAPVADQTITLTFIDAQNLTLDIPVVGNDTVCLVKITNGQDDAFDRFSALVFGNSSGNIPAPQTSPQSLMTARRAHGAAVVGATRAARYLYVVGGDDGTAAGALSSVEVAPLALTGEVAQPFKNTRYGLAAPRTHLGLVRAGRVLYAIGGSNDQGLAVATVERAVVLDPTEVLSLTIDDFDFGADEGANKGLDGGAWIYQTAIVFADNDPINPCGESLPSEPFLLINIPDVTVGLVLTLAWSEPDTVGTLTNRVIAGYRVYRTPSADGSLNEITFLNYVDGAANTTYFDDGKPVTAPASVTGCTPETDLKPMALGETSKWVSAGVPQLSSARKGAGIRSVRDKTTNKIFLYAVSGLDDQATP
ncbi:MAG: hypothetical protein V3T05_11415, partial [Myxococcota bacterium]